MGFINTFLLGMLAATLVCLLLIGSKHQVSETDVTVPYYHCPDPATQHVVDPRSWREGKLAESKYCIANEVK